MSEPLHIISLGAGVQSSTMALMAAAGEITPMPRCAIFADTQAEPGSVYTWLDYLEKKLSFPVHRVTAGSLAEAALVVHTSSGGNKYTNSNVPVFINVPGQEKEGVQSRQCTGDFKIDVINRRLRQLVVDQLKPWRAAHREELRLLSAYEKARKLCTKGGKSGPNPSYPQAAFNACQKAALIVQWIGISWDEWLRAKPHSKPYVRNWHPFVERRFTRNNCLAWMRENAFSEPPRSSCVFCPYHGDAEWLRLQRDEPVEFERAAQWEKDYQRALSEIPRIKGTPFLHRSCKALGQIDFAASVAEATRLGLQQPDLFGTECEGMCGV